MSSFNEEDILSEEIIYVSSNDSYNELLDILNNYIESYKTVSELSEGFDDNKDIKLKLIEITIKLHDLLLEKSMDKNNNLIFNFIVLSDNLTFIIDKYINEYKDLDLIMNAIDYLFKNEFLIGILDAYYDNCELFNKKIFHNAISLILLNKLTLYEKYMDEKIINDDSMIETDALESIFKKIKIEPIYESLKYIYENLMESYENKDFNDDDSIKFNLMELLCSFDLEEIYSNSSDSEEFN